MKKISKMMAVLVVLATVMTAGSSLMAATSDTFTITVTIKFMSVALRNEADDADFTAWDVGTLKDMNTAYAMGAGAGVNVKYACNVAIDVETWVSAQGNWTVAGAAGVDTFKLDADISDTVLAGGYAASDLTLTNATQDIATAVVAGSASKYIYYQLTTPTDISALAKADSGNIVVTVLVSPNA